MGGGGVDLLADAAREGMCNDVVGAAVAAVVVVIAVAATAAAVESVWRLLFA
jgi:hypothetical protein